MKVIYTDQSYASLEEAQFFLINKQQIPVEKVIEIISKLLDKADELETTYQQYQEEEYLKHLGMNHRRTIEGHFKIIYRVEGETIYVTDFFDSRQDPAKMKG
jgi:hypothetical protein